MQKSVIVFSDLTNRLTAVITGTVGRKYLISGNHFSFKKGFDSICKIFTPTVDPIFHKCNFLTLKVRLILNPLMSYGVYIMEPLG